MGKGDGESKRIRKTTEKRDRDKEAEKSRVRETEGKNASGRLPRAGSPSQGAGKS